MCKVVRVYRHGETLWNKAGILQGWLDSPLTDNGKRQAENPNFQPEIVYASDLGRALQTAQLMFPEVDIRIDSRLREINLGEWQGESILNLQHDLHYQMYLQHPEKFIANTQETFGQVTERMQSFLDFLIHRPENKIAVISHGVAIACLCIALQNKPLSSLWDEGMLTGGQSVTLIFDKEGWTIQSSGNMNKNKTSCVYSSDS
ncbi:histidine phosphatase family protein [Lysinibacillus yapensis]|nr:histidine phosphatase family protein [Lysinibacillus yapensis]